MVEEPSSDEETGTDSDNGPKYRPLSEEDIDTKEKCVEMVFHSFEQRVRTFLKLQR